jgi:hypothetical protein
MIEHKLKIPYQSDRERIVLALANSGYKVKVREQNTGLLDTIYWVIYEDKETEK